MEWDWKDTYKFLNLFRETDEKVIIGLLHENPNVQNTDNFKGVKHFDMPLKQLNKPLLEWMAFGYGSKYFINHHNAKLGKAVYFIVNNGGTKNENIKSIRAWFIDMDFAKIKEEFADESQAKRRKEELQSSAAFEKLEIETVHFGQNGLQYVLRGRYEQGEIEHLKRQFRLKFEEELKDAVLVQTYSGYHAYWIAKKGAQLANFKRIQRALIQKFGADVQIIKEANLMRVPGFLHQKYPQTALVKVVQWSDKRFEEAELIQALKLDVKKEQTKGFTKREIQKPVSYMSDLTRSVTVIQKQKKSDLIFKNTVPLNAPEKVTFNEALEKVLGEPLATFVQAPVMFAGKSILCPFHGDKKPSGIVYRSKLGQEVYYCHGCKVGTRNAIGLYMLHTGKGWRKAVEELAKLMNVKVIQTEFEKEQFEKYRDNRNYLEQDLKTLLPYTSRWVDRFGRKAYLRFFNDKGETKVLKEQFQYKGHNVFFISIRAIADEMDKKTIATVYNNVVLLNVLGFIERVPYEDIPEELRIRAEAERKILQMELRQQGEKGEKRAEHVRLINFYIVRNWANDADQIEKMAKLLDQIKFSMQKHTNKIAIQNLLGEEFANEIFPDNRKLPKRFESIANKLEAYVLKSIEEKGFATAEEIIQNRIRLKNKNGNFADVSIREKEDALKRAVLINERFKVKQVRSKRKKEELGFDKTHTKTIRLIVLN